MPFAIAARWPVPTSDPMQNLGSDESVRVGLEDIALHSGRAGSEADLRYGVKLSFSCLVEPTERISKVGYFDTETVFEVGL